MTGVHAALCVQDMVVERGGRPVIDGLSFELAAGEVLLLTGPNGAGKSTLLKAIAGLLQPASGVVRMPGLASEVPMAEQAHYVGHANAVRPTLTVAENAGFWAHFLLGSEQRVRPALERFGLASLAAVPTGYLSAGQRRRLALARLLLADRPIWLLDEPTSSLDAASSMTLGEVVTEHMAKGGLALIATHQPIAAGRSRELRLGHKDAKPA